MHKPFKKFGFFVSNLPNGTNEENYDKRVKYLYRNEKDTLKKPSRKIRSINQKESEEIYKKNYRVEECKKRDSKAQSSHHTKPRHSPHKHYKAVEEAELIFLSASEFKEKQSHEKKLSKESHLDKKHSHRDHHKKKHHHHKEDVTKLIIKEHKHKENERLKKRSNEENQWEFRKQIFEMMNKEKHDHNVNSLKKYFIIDEQEERVQAIHDLEKPPRQKSHQRRHHKTEPIPLKGAKHQALPVNKDPKRDCKNSVLRNIVDMFRATEDTNDEKKIEVVYPPKHKRPTPRPEASTSFKESDAETHKHKSRRRKHERKFEIDSASTPTEHQHKRRSKKSHSSREKLRSEDLHYTSPNRHRHRRCLVRKTLSIVDISPGMDIVDSLLEKRKNSTAFQKYYSFDSVNDAIDASYQVLSDSNKIYNGSDYSIEDSHKSSRRSSAKNRIHSCPPNRLPIDNRRSIKEKKKPRKHEQSEIFNNAASAPPIYRSKIPVLHKNKNEILVDSKDNKVVFGDGKKHETGMLHVKNYSQVRSRSTSRSPPVTFRKKSTENLCSPSRKTEQLEEINGKPNNKLSGAKKSTPSNGGDKKYGENRKFKEKSMETPCSPSRKTEHLEEVGRRPRNRSCVAKKSTPSDGDDTKYGEDRKSKEKSIEAPCSPSRKIEHVEEVGKRSRNRSTVAKKCTLKHNDDESDKKCGEGRKAREQSVEFSTIWKSRDKSVEKQDEKVNKEIKILSFKPPEDKPITRARSPSLSSKGKNSSLSPPSSYREEENLKPANRPSLINRDEDKSECSANTKVGSQSESKFENKTAVTVEKKYKTFERSSTRGSMKSSTNSHPVDLEGGKSPTSLLLTKNFKDDDKLNRWFKRKQYADTVRKNLINKAQNMKAVPPQVMEVRFVSVTRNKQKKFKAPDTIQIDKERSHEKIIRRARSKNRDNNDKSTEKITHETTNNEIKTPGTTSVNKETESIKNKEVEDIQTNTTVDQKELNENSDHFEKDVVKNSVTSVSLMSDFCEDDLPDSRKQVALVPTEKFNELFDLPIDKALEDILEENSKFLKKDFSIPALQNLEIADEDSIIVTPKTEDTDTKDVSTVGSDEWYNFSVTTSQNNIEYDSSLNEIYRNRKFEPLDKSGSRTGITDSCSAPGSEESGYSTVKSRESFFQRPSIQALLQTPVSVIKILEKSKSTSSETICKSCGRKSDNSVTICQKDIAELVSHSDGNGDCPKHEEKKLKEEEIQSDIRDLIVTLLEGVDKIEDQPVTKVKKKNKVGWFKRMKRVFKGARLKKSSLASCLVLSKS